MSNGEISIVIENPTEGQFLQRIDWNKTEFMNLIAEITKNYANVVYSDEQMKEAKADRAKLNSMKKAISDRRILVKKEIMKPYEQFEEEVKEVTALIDEPIQMIDNQIKEYEEQVKAEKKEKIKSAYDENIGDLDEDLPFERVFDSRYLNTTFTLSKALAEVKEKIAKFKTDLETIDGLSSKHKLNVRDVYIQTLDLSKAMAEDRRLNELEERMEAERKAKEEAERKRLEAEAARHEEMERQKAEAEHHREADNQDETDSQIQTAQEEESKPITDTGRVISSIEQHAISQVLQNEQDVQTEQENTTDNTESVIDSFEEKRYKTTFWIKGTLEQIRELSSYMIEKNIEFGKVEK